MITSRFLRLAALCGALFSLSLFAKDDKADIAAVIAAEKARGAALLSADLKALNTLMAEDCRYTHSSGKVESKKDHIDTFVNGLRYDRFVTSDIHGHSITPDVVVLNGKIDQRKGVAGKWAVLNLFFQAVWRREAGDWRLASLQTALAPAAAPAKK
ncbi:MAG: nuclear transport factor 2 family protein [Opitutus sp.]|nr:nuclear transport factor 2 family protein [Opitutus sp.]